ncbi:recombinase family protein [Umezawaea endophytica]|uniref:Recombinase family protein n=1 Tax=Umezawaea endophytica TaxID=1654476 RepID=A0A9X2VYR3_9PSEU|nr:recombinase family protein [Umezawaea endophytica]MCS7484642.1 recombinase family protein [Umezawaea endophytica]
MRVATYTRRSTDDENQPYTIDAQDTRLESYVASQPGWRIVKKFSDDASGANTNRPDLQKALHWARSGRIDVLLVYRVDRFSRNLRDTVTLLDELDQSGVAFRSATEPFDTSTPMGRLLLQMLSMFAQFERDMIIDRVTSGMERKAARGQYKGGKRPFGYLKDPKTHVLYAHDSEAAIIRLIFDLYTKDRLGSRAVAKVLNERGFRSGSGGLWSYRRILQILENRMYIGEISFREITTENAHPGLISPEQFAEAQHLLDQRGESASHSAASGSDYIATGRLPCPKCGKAMVGTRATGKTKTYRYYTCVTRQKYGTDTCDMERINADALDQAVLGAVSSFYRSQQSLMQQAVDVARQLHESNHDTATTELRTVQAEIGKVTSKIDKYLDAFEADLFDANDDSAKERLLRHRTTQRQLRERQAELVAELETEPTMPDAATLAQVNNHITEIFGGGNANQRKAVVEALVVQIKILSPDRIVPVFRVPQPADAKGAETELSASAPGVRACLPLVELRGLEPLTLTLPARPGRRPDQHK